MIFLYSYLVAGIPFVILFWVVTVNDLIWSQKSLPWRLTGCVLTCILWLPFLIWLVLGEVFD